MGCRSPPKALALGEALGGHRGWSLGASSGVWAEMLPGAGFRGLRTEGWVWGPTRVGSVLPQGPPMAWVWAPLGRVLTGLSWCPGALMDRLRLRALGGVQRAGREAAAGLCRQGVV